MKEWFADEKAECLICNHRWILRSDKLITDEQYYDWFDNVCKEHEEIHNREE